MRGLARREEPLRAAGLTQKSLDFPRQFRLIGAQDSSWIVRVGRGGPAQDHSPEVVASSAPDQPCMGPRLFARRAEGARLVRKAFHVQWSRRRGSDGPDEAISVKGWEKGPP